MGLLALLWRNGYRTALEGTMSCILSTKNLHAKKASQISVKPFCMEKNIPHGRQSLLPSFYPWPVCSLFSIVFQCTEEKQPPFHPSLLLHGWAPAGFLRGLRRCCFYRDSPVMEGVVPMSGLQKKENLKAFPCLINIKSDSVLQNDKSYWYIG